MKLFFKLIGVVAAVTSVIAQATETSRQVSGSTYHCFTHLKILFLQDVR